MARKKSKVKVKETVKLTARPVYNAKGERTNWEVSNGKASVVATSETQALKLLNASVAKNVNRHIVVAEHVGSDGRVVLCRRYEKKGGKVETVDLPVAATTPKSATPNTTPAQPGQRVATGKTPATKTGKTPATKTSKTPATKGTNSGLKKYQSWAKKYRAEHPNVTKEQLSKAWAAHSGKAPEKTTTKKTTTAPAPAPAAPAPTGKTAAAKKKAAAEKRKATIAAKKAAAAAAAAPAAPAPTGKTAKKKAAAEKRKATLAAKKAAAAAAAAPAPKETPGTRLEPLPPAKGAATTKGATTTKKKTPKAGSYPAFAKAFAESYKGDRKNLGKATGAAWKKHKAALAA